MPIPSAVSLSVGVSGRDTERHLHRLDTGTLLLLFLPSLHYLPNLAAAVSAFVFLFPLLFSFFPSVPKSGIGASTLAKTSDREGDRVGRP